MTRTILIVGATGSIGLHAARRALAAGYRTCALVRDRIRAARLLPAGTTLLVGDATDTPTVTTLSKPWIEAVQQTDSFAHVHWEPGATVSVITLDDLIAQYGEPAFCKIDVEGYELEVLRGLSRPLRTLSSGM